MYLTVKECHIAIDVRFKQLNTQRKLNIPSEIKDLALNRSILKFVEQRTNKKTNPKKEGFEDTQKRYDDIRELKREAILPTFVSSDYPTKLVYSVLPSDYLKLINDRTERQWTCDTLSYTSPSTLYRYVIIPFPTDVTTGATASYYSNFVFTVNGVATTLPSPLPTMYSADAKFELVHIVLDTINNSGTAYEAYWERYDNLYNYNCFIIVTKGTIVASGRLQYTKKDGTPYDSTNIPYTTLARGLVTLAVGATTDIKPNELVDNEFFWDMINSYYDTKNRQAKPLSYLYQNRIYVHHNLDFIPNKIHIQYIKQPILVNLLLNQSCELSKMEEIVELAVQEIYAISGDPNYKTMLVEAQVTE